MWKRKREHEEQWEETRENRVFFTFNLFFHSIYVRITAHISNFLIVHFIFEVFSSSST
jgi:hypothetical protein